MTLFARLRRGLICAFALGATPVLAEPAQPIAIVDVTVAPMTGPATLPGQTVIVRGGRIAAIGPVARVRVPRDAQRIDGRGRTLLPGLADMHMHMTVGTLDAKKPEEREAVLARAGEFLGMFLDAGVTTIRDMAGGPLTLMTREAVRSGRIEGPNMLLASPVLETRFTLPDMASYAHKVETPDQGRAEVRAALAAGYDFIKVYNQIDPPIYAAILDEARQRGIPVVGHVPFSVGLDGALAAGQKSIEHFRSYDFALDTRDTSNLPFKRYVGWLNTSDARMDSVARATAAAGVWNCPTLVTAQALRTDEQLKTYRPGPDADRAPAWLRPELQSLELLGAFSNEDRRITQSALAVQQQMIVKLAKAGAPLLIGTDTTALGIVPGWSVHDELKLFVEAGLTPYQALAAATVEPARFLGLSRETGTVEPGKRADLVLVEGDPLSRIEDARNVVGIVLNGRWRPRR